jgi:hypothetical protein
MLFRMTGGDLMGIANKKLLGLLVFVACFPVLAADFTLKLQPEGLQKARWENGRQQIDDVGRATMVRLMPTKGVVSKRTSFALFALNGSGDSFDLGPENILILLDDGSAVRMLNYDDLTREERRRQGWQNVALAFSVIARSMAAANAGNSYATGTYSGSTTGNIGAVPFGAQTFGTATIHSYDAGAAAVAGAVAAEENRRDIHDLAQSQAASMAAIDNVMQTTTVDPGNAFGGIVFFDLPSSVRSAKDPVPITLIVQVGGEEHRFRGSIQRASYAPKVITPEARFAQNNTTNPAAPLGEVIPLKKNASQIVPAGKAAAALESATLPVFGEDATRPYRIVGTVSVVLKRETAFLNAPITPDKADAALWQKAKALHADAVIHSTLGKAHRTLLNYQEAEATGVAIVYTSPDAPAQPQ